MDDCGDCDGGDRAFHFSYIMSITDQNTRYVSDQLSILAEDYADNLEQYKALTTSIILDSHVQEYCESDTRQELYQERGMSTVPF